MMEVSSTKVRSFTLIEVIVTLSISSIIFGLAFFALNIIQSKYKTYDELSALVLKWSVLDHLLKSDFDKANSIQYSENIITCLISNNKKVSYRLETDSIYRLQDEIVDTFYTPNLKYKVFYQVQKEYENGLINEMICSFDYKDSTLQMHMFKKYSSEEIINFNRK
jgi:prepilin-type N-terminal cleavage/methylation domain-containing protein